jgi:hypothetical protein
MTGSGSGEGGDPASVADTQRDAELPKGQPVFRIPKSERHNLENLIGVEASNLIVSSRRYYFAGLLMVLIAGAAYVVLATVAHANPGVQFVALALFLPGAGIAIRGGRLSSRGQWLASGFVSRQLGYWVKLGDVGPPANWQRQIAREVAIHEGRERKRWWEQMPGS